MEVTYIGVIFVTLAAFASFASMHGLVLLMGVALPLQAAAAVNLPALSNVSILCSTLLVGLFVARSAIEFGAGRHAGDRLRISPADLCLCLLAVYGVISGLLFPRILEGVTSVYSLDRGIVGFATRESGLPLVPLRPTSGNITQPAYLVTSCLLFLLLVRVFRTMPALAPRFVAAIAVSHAVVGMIDAMTPLLPVEPILDFIRTANYAIADVQVVVGMRRVIGGTSEPSVFGGISATLTAYYLFLASATRQPRYWLAALLFTLLCFGSLSSSALLAWLLAVSAFTLVQARPKRGFFSLRSVAGVLAVFVVAIVVALGMLHTPALTALDRASDYLFFYKLSGQSGIERTEWARQSLQNFVDTYGIGVGLGSSKPSGWIFGVLGQTGIIGFVLMLGFLFTSIFRSSRRIARNDIGAGSYFRPARAAACTALITAILAGDRVDLGYLFFAMAALATASWYGEHRSAAEFEMGDDLEPATARTGSLP